MDFKPLSTVEQQKLRQALRMNAEANAPLHMDRNTTFLGGDGTAADVTDEEVVNAIRSVPCHYTVIRPTIGRVVWYKATLHEDYPGARAGFQAAMICAVLNDRLVNLLVVDQAGNTMGRTMVPLIQPGDESQLQWGYCCWPEYHDAGKSTAALEERLHQQAGAFPADDDDRDTEIEPVGDHPDAETP
jgi:hypothetical protein